MPALNLTISNPFVKGSTDNKSDQPYWAYFADFLSSLINKKTNQATDWASDLEGTIDWTDFALETLDEIYEECSGANWDEYNAQPISREKYSEASKLLRMLPNSFPVPDILPEPDGGIGLEWYQDKDFSFAISITGKNIITYVGQFGKNNQIYGTETFTDSVSDVILNGLKRLFSQ